LIFPSIHAKLSLVKQQVPFMRHNLGKYYVRVPQLGYLTATYVAIFFAPNFYIRTFSSFITCSISIYKK